MGASVRRLYRREAGENHLTAWSPCCACLEPVRSHLRYRRAGVFVRAGEPVISTLETGDGSERYRLLIEAISDYAIFMLDAGGHVASWNPGAERFKGYKPHEII